MRFAPFLLIPALSVAKPIAESDPKHEIHYTASEDKLLGDGIKVEFLKAHSQQAFTKVDFKLWNDTADYILWKPEQQLFTIAGNKQQPFDGKEKKPELTPPNGKDAKVAKVDGGFDHHVDSFELQVGGFYRAAAEGKVLESPDFRLPPSKNDWRFGPFECALGNTSQETDLTAATFSCTYRGEGVGFVDPSRIGVRIDNGDEYANSNNKQKQLILMKGETAKFNAMFTIDAKTVDMQFAKLNVLWRDTFRESLPQAIPLGTWKLTRDEAKTAKSND
jgi:hypothetical protein